jgi:hypothetical protein
MAIANPRVSEILTELRRDPIVWVSAIGIVIFIYVAITTLSKNPLILLSLYVSGFVLMGLNFYVRYELVKLRIQYAHKMRKMDDILLDLNHLKTKTAKLSITTKTGVKKR